MIYSWCLWAYFANLFYIPILNMKDADYCCIISGISKSEAVKLSHHIKYFQKEKRSYVKSYDGQTKKHSYITKSGCVCFFTES